MKFHTNLYILSVKDESISVLAWLLAKQIKMMCSVDILLGKKGVKNIDPLTKFVITYSEFCGNSMIP